MKFTMYQLAKDVLKKLGVMNGRDVLKPDDLEDVIRAAWVLFDRWSTEELMIPFVSRFVFNNVTSSKRVYTVGPDGDFVMPWPLSIEAMAFRDAAGTDYTVQLTDLQNYNEGMHYKETSIGRPRRAFYNPSFPNGELSFDIFPQDSENLILWAKVPFDVETCSDVGVTCTTGCCYGGNSNSCDCSGNNPSCSLDDFSYSVSSPVTLSQQAYASIISQAKVLLKDQYGDSLPCDCPLSVNVTYSGGDNGPVNTVVTAKQKAPITYNPIRFDEFIQLPPGFYNTIMWNLVVDMEVSQDIAIRAMNGMRKLKDRNNQTPQLRVDRALLVRSRVWSRYH